MNKMRGITLNSKTIANTLFICVLYITKTSRSKTAMRGFVEVFQESIKVLYLNFTDKNGRSSEENILCKGFAWNEINRQLITFCLDGESDS